MKFFDENIDCYEDIKYSQQCLNFRKKECKNCKNCLHLEFDLSCKILHKNTFVYGAEDVITIDNPGEFYCAFFKQI